MSAEKLRELLQSQSDAMLKALRSLVEHESPSLNKAALDPLARTIADRFRSAGATVSLIANADGGDHVLARFDSGVPSYEKPALVIGHYDTVWPIGTLAERPFHVRDERAHGPGVFDMKASVVLVEFALKALRAKGLSLPRSVHVLITSDEEVGSPTSRALIEDQARMAAYVLVLEPPLPGGRLKTARKGVGQFTISVAGRAAHAGIEPEKGVSAVVELAHQILRVQELENPSAGTTVNVGMIQGGSAANVVAAEASANVDVRVTTIAESRRIEEAVRNLKPVREDARVTVQGRFNRPPMERTQAVAALFERAQPIGRLLGMELLEGSTGGASDGNFTAALGVPTVDGLGALGDGAHANTEHILVRSLPERAALLAMLLWKLAPETS
jgi:glutamate carboxypeptidase